MNVVVRDTKVTDDIAVKSESLISRKDKGRYGGMIHKKAKEKTANYSVKPNTAAASRTKPQHKPIQVLSILNEHHFDSLDIKRSNYTRQLTIILEA